MQLQKKVYKAIKKLPLIEVCLSPSLLPLYDIENKIVVVIDIFRASSAICAGIANGIAKIIPVPTVEEALKYKQQGYITAAERGGSTVDGFDMGNSPYSFLEERLQGQTVVMTTSNCTNAIYEARAAKELYIGSFLNMQAIVELLAEKGDDVVLLCAGWKNKIHLEDTLFAGALIDHLQHKMNPDCDAAATAHDIYRIAKDDMNGYLQKASHTRRLSGLGVEEDVIYALTPNQFTTIPVFKDGEITALKQD